MSNKVLYVIIYGYGSYSDRMEIPYLSSFSKEKCEKCVSYLEKINDLIPSLNLKFKEFYKDKFGASSYDEAYRYSITSISYDAIRDYCKQFLKENVDKELVEFVDRFPISVSYGGIETDYDFSITEVDFLD